MTLKCFHHRDTYKSLFMAFTFSVSITATTKKPPVFCCSVSVVHKKISDVQKTPEHWGCLHIRFSYYSISIFCALVCDMTRNINSVKRGQLELNLSINYFTTVTHCYDDENSNHVRDLPYTERIVYQGCSESSFV